LSSTFVVLAQISLNAEKLKGSGEADLPYDLLESPENGLMNVVLS
jgi:hypothetical protein